MVILRIAGILALCLGLSACSAPQQWASDADVARAHYVSDQPPSVTLFTVISNTNESGAHSGLLINGSEQVMFDPAGSWHHPSLPERNDVHFGVTPRMVSFYIDYHARETFRVVEQTVPVSREVADAIIARAKAYGPVPKAQCANSISSILKGVPGFEVIGGTWWPKALSADFAKLPGATSKLITDDDADDHHGVLIVQAGLGDETEAD